MRPILQVAAFVRKETTEVLRQPRLLVVLVLGPFVILLLFGTGYREDVRRYDTLFVAPSGSVFEEQVDRYAAELDRFVNLVGTVSDQDEAMRQLRDGNVDVVVVFPEDPLSQVLTGERAEIHVIHDSLDPIEQTAMEFAAQIAVDEVNAQVLAAVVSEGQSLAGPVEAVVGEAQQGWEEVRPLVASGTATESDLEAWTRSVDRLALIATNLDALVQEVGSGASSTAGADAVTTLTETSHQFATSARDLQAAGSGLRSVSNDETIARIDEIIARLPDDVHALRAVDAEVLVRPFVSDVETATADRSITDYYAPATLVLLLQHFGVTFGALTFVRERALGITEIFQVAPVRGLQILTGKYLSYLFLGGLAGAALTALIVGGLSVPVAGSWAWVAVVLLAVLAASIGLGFLISLVARTDSQAVQYSMITLLASLFFSGFFLSIEQLNYPARLVSWLLPVTYGIQLLQEVMLRGDPPESRYLVALAVYALVAAVCSTLLVRRSLAVR